MKLKTALALVLVALALAAPQNGSTVEPVAVVEFVPPVSPMVPAVEEIGSKPVPGMLSELATEAAVGNHEGHMALPHLFPRLRGDGPIRRFFRNHRGCH